MIGFRKTDVVFVHRNTSAPQPSLTDRNVRRAPAGDNGHQKCSSPIRTASTTVHNFWIRKTFEKPCARALEVC